MIISLENKPLGKGIFTWALKVKSTYVLTKGFFCMWILLCQHQLKRRKRQVLWLWDHFIHIVKLILILPFLLDNQEPILISKKAKMWTNDRHRINWIKYEMIAWFIHIDSAVPQYQHSQQFRTAQRQRELSRQLRIPLRSHLTCHDAST